jgi:ADP-ribose pyrophosphatase
MAGKKGEARPEKLLLRKYVFEGKAMKVRVDTVLSGDLHRSTREVVERGDCVAMVAVDAEENVLLVNQFRTPLWKNLLEIPAGGIEPRETAEAAVVREMQEETGLKPAKVVRLCGFFFSPGYSNEYCHLYLAADLTPSQLKAEDTFNIEVVKLPLAEIVTAIASGRIQDGKSIAGLMYYLEWKKNNPVITTPETTTMETGAPATGAPAIGDNTFDAKDALDKVWAEFQAVPFPQSPEDEALADLYADLVLEKGEITGIVNAFLQGDKVEKTRIYLNEDLNRKLVEYKPAGEAAAVSQQDLIQYKQKIDKLVSFVLMLYDNHGN